MTHFAAMATPAPAMAALTIQDVLRYPLVSQTIKEMNELIPGVPVTRENIQTLFDNYEDVIMGFRRTGRGMGVRISRHKKLISVDISAPVTGCLVILDQKQFPNTPDGFFQALMWTKDILKRYREDGPCPDCARDEFSDQQPARKRMKLANMPKCSTCMIKAITNFGDGSDGQ